MHHNLGRITRLKRIVYKNGQGAQSLTGIGFEFTGSFKSPIFQNRLAAVDDKSKVIHIDTIKRIKEVSFYIFDGKQFNGIRIKDVHGKTIAFEQWKPHNYKCEWVT